MAVEKKIVIGTVGQTFVQDAALAFVEVLFGYREMGPMVETSGTPTGRQFKHVREEGKVILPDDFPVGNFAAENTPLTKFAYKPEEFYFEYKTI